jgi:tetratricopeptide (TPR) repeat protein
MGENETPRTAEDLAESSEAQKPISSHAALDLAIAHYKAGRYPQAGEIYRQILKIQPDNISVITNLGAVYRAQGNLDKAIACYRRALEIKPDFANACGNLANALKDKGLTEEAIRFYRRAIDINPGFAEAYNSLGVMLKDRGDVDEAIACFEQGLALSPDNESANNNLGALYKEMGEPERAISYYRQALETKPDFADAHNNLANALKDLGKVDEAMASYDRAIEIEAGHVDAHFNRSMTLLLLGDYAKGWVEHEWRWKRKNDSPFMARKREFVQPLWDGSPLEGRTILLHAEQGFGDSIQFIRYLPMVAARGGRVVLECHRLLTELFHDLPGIDDMIENGRQLPPFDVHAPFLSLPMIFGTTLETIPEGAGYLRATPFHIKSWGKRLSSLSRPRVGLCWQGNPNFQGDRWRSIPLHHFTDLVRGTKASFVNLHKGDGIDQIAACGLADRIADFSAEVDSLLDTAAIMEHLDLVITSDTSVAHLAGALGKPTWVLLQFLPDWRWLLEREDSPWYPTMRLFRQKTRGDWAELLARAEEALGAYLADF